MARRYSTRSRRPDGSAAAEPAVGGLSLPGAPPSGTSGYFEHSEFRGRLEELREACDAPGAVVLVTGPAGAGKSVVCEALLAEIEPPRCVASVSASLVAEPYPEILAAILEAYGFKVDPGTTPQVMAELIAHHASDPALIGRRCVVVVDDAHELPARDLQGLLALVDSTALTLVLAGPMNLAPAIERVAQQFALPWHEVRLTGLSIGEVNAYLEWRQAREAARTGKVAGRPLTEDQVKDLTRRSRGLPGRLEELVARLQSAGAPVGRVLGPFGFPMRHLVILAGLALVLLVVWIVGRFAEEVTTATSGTQRVETLEMPPLPALGDSAESPDGPAPVRPQVSSQADLPVPARATGAAEQPVAAPRPIIARPPSSAPPDTASRPAASERPATAAVPAAPVPAAPVPAAPISAPAASTPAASAPAAPASGAPSPARPAPAGGAAPRNASWILAQPAGYYTLQLVSLSSAERAQSYIAQQPDPGSFATYRLLRNGQLFHVVLYGAFATKSQADQAAARLPRTAGNIQPWVRPFEQVQQSVRTTPQQ